MGGKYIQIGSSDNDRVAVVTMGVKLGNEVKGYTRFLTIAQMLSEAGFEVDLITSSFQHWEKAQRDKDDAAYKDYPFNVVFIDEPGYRKNLDLRRIRSHRIAAKNLKRFFEEQFSRDSEAYSLVYAEIPPNDVARVCADECTKWGIPFVVDVNDLWPEAMRMAVDIPVVSDIAFAPFARDAKAVYSQIAAAVGTSDEYASRPEADRDEPYLRRTIYVGNDIGEFDEGVSKNLSLIEKPDGEVWVAYAGTLGASYDLETLIRASKAAAGILQDRGITFRLKLLGDGPDREKLEELAKDLDAPADILGYMPYDRMAAWLSASDILVNSLVKAAPQSIVTKIGDYLAAGRPMVNTGSSPEFRDKVENDGFGVNVEAEDVPALTDALIALSCDSEARDRYGKRAREIAESQFDRKNSYKAIVELVGELAAGTNKS